MWEMWVEFLPTGPTYVDVRQIYVCMHSPDMMGINHYFKD